MLYNPNWTLAFFIFMHTVHIPHNNIITNGGKPMSDQVVIDPEITSDDKLWGLLCYIFTPIVPIIILLIEDKKNRPFLKAHTVQALVLGIVLWLINSILAPVLIGCFTGLATIILMIYYGIKAYNGEYITIPVITDFVKKQGWA